MIQTQMNMIQTQMYLLGNERSELTSRKCAELDQRMKERELDWRLEHH